VTVLDQWGVLVPDVVDMIMSDHREVERLFGVLKNEPEKRRLALPTLSALLTAHTRAEEAEVYPVARKEAEEGDEIAAGQQEHLQAERLLQRLHATDPDSTKFDSILEQLTEAIKHHIDEEENTILPGLRNQLDHERLQRLGQAFAASREEHIGERPGEANKGELVQQAENVGISNASTMLKEELATTLSRQG
jgi:hemerythrin-like domain-containing protein